MKRLAIILTAVGVIGFAAAGSASASDRGHHGYAGHTAYGQRGGYSHAAPIYRGNHSYGRDNHSYGQRYSPRHDRHAYGRYGHGGHRTNYGYGHDGYRNGHGISIRTPHFGLRIGH